jgi:hypothetical protein
MIKTSMEVGITSPTRECQYTLAEVLRKGLERSSLTAASWDLSLRHECFYGSRDFALSVEGLRPSESRWTNSINFQIDGIIPVHTTEGGKIDVGFKCGCDKRHNGQFPSEAPPDNPEWDSYKKTELAIVTFWLGQDIGWLRLEDIPVDDSAWDVLAALVREFLSREMCKVK